MPWFKVDDSFYDHPKVFDAPDCALALWTRAGCWSARNLTDGFVPASLPARLCDDPDTAVRVLIDRGLWKRTRGGYQYHDWADYQPSAASVRDLRAKRAEAGRKGGQARAANQNAGKPLASASEDAKQNATPARPDPTRGSGSVGESSSPRNARTREDDDLDQKIDERIIALLAELTGRTVTPEHAAKVRRRILDGRHVDNPVAYVTAAIRGTPRDYLPGGDDPASRPLREALQAAADHGQHADPNAEFRRERERLEGQP